MTYRGHIKNGQITLDEPAQLPEGASVNIEVVDKQASNDAALESLLLDRIRSGQSRPMTDSDFDDIRRRLADRAAQGHKP